VQAVAGTGDFSNLEQAENYVEALKKAADPASPAKLAFGPRTIGYTLYPNLSGNGWGEPDANQQAIRELNRNLDFRKAISYGLDRLKAAGLEDSDSNGFVNLPGGVDLNVTLLTQSDYTTDKNLAEGVVAMMADAGVQVSLNALTGKDFDNAR